ncbi:MAG: RNA-binding protein [Thiomargarita sp.]|nr:RNA-binding protein [Thiomargarita sp.]
MQKLIITKKIRLDKWLWVARFFKTRRLATEATTGGKIHLNGQRTKPSKEVHIGDKLDVRVGYIKRSIIVQALSMQRRSAKEAVLLYQETIESIEKREKAQELHRQTAICHPSNQKKLTKKDRRAIHKFKNNY